MKRFCCRNGMRGAATVEAVISFTGFLFVIFTILNVVNVCRAQMLMSSAVDAAAKELAHYAYFCDITGMKNFDSQVQGVGTKASDNINGVIGTVNTLYQSIGTLGTDTTQQATNLADAASDFQLDQTDLGIAVNNIKADGSNVVTAYNNMKAAFTGVSENPIVYMKSLVTVVTTEGYDMAKSALLAVLAESMVKKHLGTEEEIKALGISDMNFLYSTLFDNNSDEIHIVVYYKVKLVNFFSSEKMEAAFCKESLARAWLGGDDND